MITASYDKGLYTVDDEKDRINDIYQLIFRLYHTHTNPIPPPPPQVLKPRLDHYRSYMTLGQKGKNLHNYNNYAKGINKSCQLTLIKRSLSVVPRPLSSTSARHKTRSDPLSARVGYTTLGRMRLTGCLEL